MERKPSISGLVVTMGAISGKWKLMIRHALKARTLRFCQLRREVAGISEKMLIMSLKELNADGIVNRKDFHEVSRRVEYSLSAAGDSLTEILTPLCKWGCERRGKLAECDARDEEDRFHEKTSACGNHASGCSESATHGEKLFSVSDG